MTTRVKTVRELKLEWKLLYGHFPQSDLGRDHLARSISWKQQEKLHGGLAPDVYRELGRLALQLKHSGDLDVERLTRLKTGTRLVREWHGDTYRVTVTESGFLFQERHYVSLTQIAREITGTNWSGPRFFGLKQRRRVETANG